MQLPGEKLGENRYSLVKEAPKFVQPCPVPRQEAFGFVNDIWGAMSSRANLAVGCV